MPAPFSNLRSKLNRAIAAYLVNAGCGSIDDILPANATVSIGYPNTVINSRGGVPEIPMTGIYRVTVYIQVRGTATDANGEPNLQAGRIAFDQRVAQTYDALMQGDNGIDLTYTAAQINAAGRGLATPFDNSPAAISLAKNNSDMVDFSIVGNGWYDKGFGDGEPDEEGCAWMEVMIFEAVCCASNCQN